MRCSPTLAMENSILAVSTAKGWRKNYRHIGVVFRSIRHTLRFAFRHALGFAQGRATRLCLGGHPVFVARAPT
jgi:hypothetical protein